MVSFAKGPALMLGSQTVTVILSAKESQTTAFVTFFALNWMTVVLTFMKYAQEI